MTDNQKGVSTPTQQEPKAEDVIRQALDGLADVVLAKWACWGPKGCEHPRSEHEDALVATLMVGYRRAGMDWWNGLAEADRRKWLGLSGGESVAEAWAYFKLENRTTLTTERPHGSTETD